MGMLRLKESKIGLAKANGMQWLRHIIKEDVNNVLRLAFKVDGRKQGKPKIRKVQEGGEGSWKNWIPNERC